MESILWAAAQNLAGWSAAASASQAQILTMLQNPVVNVLAVLNVVVWSLHFAAQRQLKGARVPVRIEERRLR